METITKRQLKNLKEVTYVENFVDYELIKNNPMNRCSAYNGGEHCRQEVEEALKYYSPVELAKSTSIIRDLIKNIKKDGYKFTQITKMFVKIENGNPVVYNLDNHHLTRAVREIYHQTGNRIPMHLIIYPENKIPFDEASDEMCYLNMNGSRRWEFVDIVRSLDTPAANMFKESFRLYGNKVNSVAVVANAVLNANCSATRRNAKSNFGRTDNTGLWRYANEYLESLTSMKLNRKISEEVGNAYRTLFDEAVKSDVLPMFKAFFATTPINVNFQRGGRPKENQWLAQLVSIMDKNRHFDAYKTATAYQQQKYRKFLNKVRQLVDYRTLYNDSIAM